jgi:hypothetical protein
MSVNGAIVEGEGGSMNTTLTLAAPWIPVRWSEFLPTIIAATAAYLGLEII